MVNDTDEGRVRQPGRPDRWPAPLRDLFPWWYVAGMVASFAVILVVVPEGSTGAVAVWGPLIGLTIRDRAESARSRSDRGLPIDRAALTAPRWSEPALTLVWTGVSVGLGLVLSVLIRDAPAAIGWTGAGLLVASAAGFTGVALTLRAHARRAR